MLRRTVLHHVMFRTTDCPQGHRDEVTAELQSRMAALHQEKLGMVPKAQMEQELSQAAERMRGVQEEAAGLQAALDAAHAECGDMEAKVMR